MEDAEAVEDESGHWLIKYLSVSSKRYHRKRKKHRRSTLLPMFINECNLVLQEDGGTCSEVDFKQCFGMFRESFWKLHSRIKNHSVFSTKKGTKQIPSQFQLLVYLNWLRTEGDGESSHKGRRGWKCSVGNLGNCRKRCAAAIVGCLFESSVFWPDEVERQQIAAAIEEINGFPDCIGIVDGTLFPLWSKPQREDFADYFGRKMGYSLTCLVVNDHKRRVRYFHLGWPGSVHDERVRRLILTILLLLLLFVNIMTQSAGERQCRNGIIGVASSID